MSKEVKGVTPELVVETLKHLEPRLVPSENGVIDLNKEVREKWEELFNGNRKRMNLRLVKQVNWIDILNKIKENENV